MTSEVKEKIFSVECSDARMFAIAETIYQCASGFICREKSLNAKILQCNVQRGA
jgi:hypothetical protein